MRCGRNYPQKRQSPYRVNGKGILRCDARFNTFANGRSAGLFRHSRRVAASRQVPTVFIVSPARFG